MRQRRLAPEIRRQRLVQQQAAAEISWRSQQPQQPQRLDAAMHVRLDLASEGDGQGAVAEGGGACVAVQCGGATVARPAAGGGGAGAAAVADWAVDSAAAPWRHAAAP
jgi:hypothetical protein